MSSILSEYTSKYYHSISDLPINTDVVSDFNFNESNLTRGFIHTLYSKISYNEYNKLFDIYSNVTNIDNQYFYYYSNNKVGLMTLEDRNANTISIEKWDFIPPSSVYSFNYHPSCYAIDEFEGRKFVDTANLINMSSRLCAYGSWFTNDYKRHTFLGCRLVPIPTDPKECSNIEIVDYDTRQSKNMTRLTWNSAKYINFDHSINRRVDYFIIFRNLSLPNIIYNEYQIVDLYKSQDLLHLVSSTDLRKLF
ncbi:hypothetical protein PmNV_097 [Penaeus monodon nudivirus]|uniref:Uncharacterized protein n=1 Tax=Penaeus monodon nudivirus TaxID=1529056 RepID=A0A076FE25_9VIRU|nr:hypothetical protein PmNV_097 [Penaeus monodon nudivirus]AII15885.1 hypothetical protein PmNV_097 [Penaeus monodon nudivirus]